MRSKESSARQPEPLSSTSYSRPSGDLFVPLFPLHLGNAVGNQIISAEDEAVLLDFGHNRNHLTKFYPHHNPSFHDGIVPLIDYGIYPASMQSLLRKDLPNQPEVDIIYDLLLGDAGEERAENYTRNLQFQSEIDTVAIAATHAHADHVGNIPATSTDVKIVSTPETYALLKANQEQAKRGWYSELVEVKQERKKEKKVGREYIDLRPGEEYSVNEDQEYSLKMIPTSHWFGSAAAELTLPSGNRVMHTGDLNWGSETEKLASYLYKQDPYTLMFLDATHFGNPYPVFDELEIRLELRERFKEDGPMFMMINEMDMTRFHGVLTAAKSTKRHVYIHPTIAKQLNTFRTVLGTRHRELPNPDDFRVLQPPGSRLPKFDEAFQFTTYDEIKKRHRHYATHKNGKKDVFVLSRPDQLMNLGHHGLVSRGNNEYRKRLIVSTYGYNPATNGKSRWMHLKDVANHLGMDKKDDPYLSGHHMRTNRFSDFLRYVSAETVVLFHTDPKYEAALKDYVRTNAREVKRVLTDSDIEPEVPMTFEGTKLRPRSQFTQIGFD